MPENLSGPKQETAREGPWYRYRSVSIGRFQGPRLVDCLFDSFWGAPQNPTPKPNPKVLSDRRCCTEGEEGRRPPLCTTLGGGGLDPPLGVDPPRGKTQCEVPEIWGLQKRQRSRFHLIFQKKTWQKHKSFSAKRQGKYFFLFVAPPSVLDLLPWEGKGSRTIPL